MKSLRDYILEKENDDTLKRDILFTIWERPDKKVKWLNDNKSYQKIEYKYQTDDIEIDFLLGTQDDCWKLWMGKIGSVSYDDDPYCSFETNKFSEAIIMALDKVEEIINEVKKDKKNWIQFYVHI